MKKIKIVTYLLGKIERSNAQRPETTEHGEESQAQVILRDHDGKVAFTVCITEIITGGVLRSHNVNGNDLLVRN